MRADTKLRVVIFSASACLFSLEIVLAQILGFLRVTTGVVQVLPIAFLGLGVGGLLAFLSPRRALLEPCLVGAALSVALSFLTIHFTLSVFWLMAVFTVPFAFLGAVIAIGLSIGRKPGIYIVDLLGGALGCVLTVLLFEPVGAELMWMAIGLALALMAVFLRDSTRRMLAIGSAAPPLVLIAFQLATGNLDLIHFMAFREPADTQRLMGDGVMRGNRFIRLPQVQVVASRWSLVSRVDVIQSPTNPWNIFFDPDFGTHLRQPSHRPPVYSLYYNNILFSNLAMTKPAVVDYSSFKPYLDWFEDPNLVVVGPGGGLDLVIALERGVRRITGVEINPSTVDLMRDLLVTPSAGAYLRSRIVTMDGRTFIHNADTKFDVIDLAAVASYLSFLHSNVHIESYLHTVEAFGDYLDHLTNEGVIQMDVYSRNPMGERARIVAAAAAALRARGLDPAERIVFLTEDTGYRLFGTNPGVILVRRTPFTPEQIEDIAAFCDTSPNRHLEYAPPSDRESLLQENDPFLMQLVAREEPSTLYAQLESRGTRIHPTTDDRPFFYSMDASEARLVAMVKWTVFSVVALSGALLVAVMGIRNRRGLAAASFRSPLVWACAVSGASYALAQLALIQRFNVFVGSPIASFVSVILGIVGGGALGAWLGRRFSATRCSLCYAGAAGILVAIGTPILFEPNAIVMPSMAMRVALTLGLTFPVGVLISAPFPRILEGLEREQAGTAVLGYGLNALCLVIATSMGLAVTAFLGFSALAIVAASIYVLNAPLLHRGLQK